MILTPEAEKLINQYAVTLAKAYSVATTKHMFTISQPQEIKLRKALLDSTAFLKEISMLSVNQIKGAVVEAGVSKLLTGRKKMGASVSIWALMATNTNCAKRIPARA